MNILFVCSAKSWGGNEKWTTMAMKALSVQHNIFFIGKSSQLISKFEHNGAHALLPFRSYFDGYTFSKMKSFIKQHNIELIISTKKKEYFQCGIISSQLGIKHIMRLGANRKMNIPFWHSLNYQKLNDGLLVNSEYIAQNLRRYPFFQHHPIHVLHNGISGFLSDSEPTVNKFDSCKFIIASSGRITKLKGYQILIEAIALLPDSLKQQLEVRIIGEGRNKEEFVTQYKDRSLEHIVSFIGFVENPTDHMKDANLFVLLSEREGLSNSILEAMTLSIPILSTDTGGIKELIKDGETGYLVERNAQAVANKLAALIKSSTQLPKIGQAGFEVVKEKFAFDLFEKNINDLINKIIEK